jgi:microsomal dipeptidase-like Zn-dependent dipeptidase
MTLCHNGDNDICDSARGIHSHCGVSAFGHRVIEEMNRLGMIIDLSHAGEQTFFQTVETSQKPVVCTHSNCRALCDHPRNLTDEQMKTLAEAGGVMQLTLYAGFLRDDDQQASICDFIRHMKHAVSIMGIDHVGIGSDFDGDGGVSGAANAAELLNITCHLIKAGFSDTDIEKIWGGNFMRIMHLHGM